METLYRKAVRTTLARSSANVCLGVCRTGTTALAQVYAQAGFAAFYQPVKADFRLIFEGENPNNFDKVLQAVSTNLFVKETFGPFFNFETQINYLSYYQLLGIDLEKSHFIIAFRDPAGIFASWLNRWNDTQTREELFDIYVKAELALSAIELEIIRRHATITYYCHHFSQAKMQNFALLFERSKPCTRFERSVLDDWQVSNLSQSKVQFPKEPSFFSRESIHETTPYFCAPPGQYAAFSLEEEKILIEKGIYQNYGRRLSKAILDIN